MRASIESKKMAIKLRRKGLSYNEIRQYVKVAKSSLSLWLKDIELKPEHRERLYTKKIQVLNLGTKSQKERREREIQGIIDLAEQEVVFPLSEDTYRLMGAALYWAEGSKTGLCEVTNSDPHVIVFMVEWIKKMFGINPKDLKARLNIYPQQDDNKIKKFWSELTGIPVDRFGKSFVKPLSTGYRKNNLYYGTIKVEIPKSVNIKHRIFGWIKSVLKKDFKIQIVQRRWEALKKYERPNPINLKNTRP